MTCVSRHLSAPPDVPRVSLHPSLVRLHVLTRSLLLLQGFRTGPFCPKRLPRPTAPPAFASEFSSPFSREAFLDHGARAFWPECVSQSPRTRGHRRWAHRQGSHCGALGRGRDGPF